jgi:hypothetical protein
MKLILGLLFAAGLAAADARTDAAKQLYDAGKYPQAEAAGVAENNAEGFTIAARAILAREAMGQPCLDCLKRAEADARRAITDDPNLPDAHTYLAATLGYEGRIVGIITARLDNYPEEAKANIDAALKIDPHNGRALAARGGWNIEVVRAGGATLASLLYGASLAVGQSEFERAFAAAPENLVLHYQYALVLSGYDPKRFHDIIAEQSARAIAGKPATAYDAFAQGRARELLDALDHDDSETFAKLVRRDQGYPQ